MVRSRRGGGGVGAHSPAARRLTPVVHDIAFELAHASAAHSDRAAPERAHADAGAVRCIRANDIGTGWHPLRLRLRLRRWHLVAQTYRSISHHFFPAASLSPVPTCARAVGRHSRARLACPSLPSFPCCTHVPLRAIRAHDAPPGCCAGEGAPPGRCGCPPFEQCVTRYPTVAKNIVSIARNVP